MMSSKSSSIILDPHFASGKADCHGSWPKTKLTHKEWSSRPHEELCSTDLNIKI